MSSGGGAAGSGIISVIAMAMAAHHGVEAAK